MIPEYHVDLDMPPSQRWNHVIDEHIDSLKDFATGFKEILHDQLSPTVARLHKPILRPLCYVKPLGKEYSQELASIAKITKKFGLTYSDLVLLNGSLDYLAKCTSAIFITTNGRVHARSLDWDMPQLKQLTIIVTFRKGGIDICKGITFVGCVGLLTVLHLENLPSEVNDTFDSNDTFDGTFAVETDAYSLSYNFRRTGMSRKRHVFTSFLANYFKQENITFLLRETAVGCRSYEEAFQSLRQHTSSLFSSGYITLCGVNPSQGSMLAYGTRFHEVYMNDRIFVQTNHDLTMETDTKFQLEKWADEDPVLLSTFERKNMITDAVKRLQFITLEDVVTIMNTPPVLNDQTIFTSYMNPRLGTLT